MLVKYSNDDIWFDVDQVALRRSKVEAMIASGQKFFIIDLFPSPITSKTVKDLGKYIALDCEFVGVGVNGANHALARVSIVNFHGQVILDKHVKPKERVTDFRSSISGVHPKHLYNAEDFDAVQREISNILTNKIVIGHALKNDFKVLLLSHPRRYIRDTSKLRRFRAITRGKTPSLKKLAREFLGLTNFQSKEHDSIDDARVAMLLYRSFKNEWENSLFRQDGKHLKFAKKAKERDFNFASHSFEHSFNQDVVSCKPSAKLGNKMVLNII